jgi:hypothetical protein
VGPPVSNDDTHIVYQSVVSSEVTPPSLATPVDDTPTPHDTILPNAPTTLAAAQQRLVWPRPVVRELPEAEANLRRDEINVAGIDAPTPDDVLPSPCRAGRSAAPKLVWRAPVITELFGGQARTRRVRAEIELAAMRAPRLSLPNARPTNTTDVVAQT